VNKKMRKRIKKALEAGGTVSYRDATDTLECYDVDGTLLAVVQV
jgi:hypothetical protein